MNKKLFFIALLSIGFIGSASAQTSITSCSDLNTMSNSGGNYQLQNDLDCSSTSFSEGVLNDGYTSFSGTFDGNGYSIKDLTINTPSSGSSNRYAGIFRKLDDATFTNVRFENPKLNVNGGDAVAGIASSRSSADISDVEVIGFEATGSGAFSNIGFFGHEDGSGSNDGTINRLTMINTTMDVDLTNGYVGAIQAQERNSYSSTQQITMINTSILSNDNGAIAASPVMNWNDIDLKNVKIVDYTVDGFINDDLLGYGYEGTLNNFFIAEATADQFSKSSSVSYSDAYIDSETSNTPTGGLTTLTTSESTGTNAETNMNFDFTNTWTTETNPDDYPALLYTKEPQITGTTNPKEGDNYDKNTQIDFKFSVNTGGQSATVDLIVNHPNGTDVTEFSESLSSGTTKSYDIQESFSNTGDYSWYVDIGTDQSSPIKFDVIDYSQPSITLSEPNSGEVFKTYQNSENVQFGFSVDSDLDGTYEVQNKNQSDSVSEYKTISSGSISSGSNAYLDFVTLNLTSDLDQRDWRVVVDDEIDGATSSSDQFTLENIDPPSIELTSPVDGSSYYLEEGGSVEIPVEGWINQSEITGEAYGTFSETNVNYEENLGDIEVRQNQFFNGSYTATQTGVYNDFRIEAKYGADVFSSSKVDVSVIRANPTFTTFNVSPSIAQAEPSDTFEVNVEGDVNRDAIDRIEYELRVDGNLEESVTKNPIDFQDQNQFTDSINQFEMKEAYQGSTVEISATVYDDQGLTDSVSSSGDTSTPPDGFIQDSPNNNQVFLIPEGDSDIPVQFEYGVNTAERGGTVELIVNSNVEDSFSISANSQQTQTFEKNYTSDDYQWKVRFTDSQDGNQYESNTLTFDVTDEPINLNLQSPSGGEQIDLVNTSEKDIDHNFEIDARALAAQYYYQFQLNNSDTGATILSRTSSNFDTGIADYTESPSALQEGNYSWKVDVYQSSDDKLLESKTSTYSLEENPLFSQDILSPVEGETFFLNETNQLDVNTTYEAKAESSNVDLTLFLDGTQVDTNTVNAGSYSTFDKTLFDVAEGDHTLKLQGEDSDGRTQNTSVNFEIAQPEETSIEFTEISTDPSLDEAKVGDEVDIYIEGSGNVDDVEYLQVDITVDGEVVDTKIIDTDNLQSGSWFITLEDALTVTQDMIGKAASIKGYAESVVGQTTSYVYDVLGIGSNRDIAVSLNAPSDGRTFEQVDGDADDIRFEFETSTLSNPVDVTLQVRPNGSSSYALAAQDTVSETDSTVVLETFVNLVNNPDINQQFGEFDWKVNATEQSSGDTAESSTNTFTVREESSAPILNFNNPSDKDTLYAGTNEENTDVQFQWDVDTEEQGTTTLEIDDYTRTFEHPTGYSQQQTTLNLPLGSYVANLTFQSDSYTVEKTHEFAIKQEEPETNDPYVDLDTPPDGVTAYKASDIEREFGWTVANFVEDGSGEGNSTLYIENSNGDVVESFSRDYDTQNEPQSYAEIYSFSNLNVGTYDWYVEFEADQMNTITSDRRTFEVKEFQPPTATLFQPDNETFTEDEYPEFEWRVESFDESPTVELRYREKGEYNSEVLFDSAQDSNAVRDYSFNESQFTRGEYEWFIRMQPDQYQTFDSDIKTFNVEPEEIKEPEINLDIPEQDEIFEIENGSESATVEFNYFVELYSDNNAEVNLMLQNVSEDSTSDYYSLQQEFQTVDDNNVTYNHLENLKENGYRYKVKVEYPNGQKEESEVRSFVVDDPETEETPEVPDPEPTEGFFDEGSILFGNLIDSYKSAVGGVGQMFTAFIVIAIGAGLTQLAFKMETLSLIVATFGTLGFALADGFLPVSFFWIVLALAAGLAALTGRSILGGGDS